MSCACTGLRPKLAFWLVGWLSGIAWEFAADTYILKFQRLQNMVLRTIGKFSKASIGPRITCGFQNFIPLRFYQ
jgi:hypothetical protein